uniref:Iron-siderophore ABC transporter substrate-binding protein n=1 Tax=Thermorudis peleae TaxID=1382356 RepID=A0A831TCE7_9BACT
MRAGRPEQWIAGTDRACLHRALSRRGFLRALAGAGGALSLAAFLPGCRAGNESAAVPGTSPEATSPTPAAVLSEPAPSRPSSPTPAPRTTPATQEQPVFPLVIRHKFGTTEIPEQPQRVATVGFSEQDPVLALGVKPIAVREWFGDQPYAVWPWAQDELGDAMPTVLRMPFGELDFEAIAALRPDLLVATHSGITADEYEALSRIAPTVAQPGEYPDFGVPWQEQTRIIGQALGRAERAEVLIAEVEAQIAAARAAHPQFEGATIAWASPSGDGQYWAVGPNTPPMRFLSALGFRMPDALAAVVGELDSAQISGEQLGLLDTDALILQVNTPEERAAIEANPLYQQLRAAREGRALFFVGLDDPLYGALSFSTVLSLPYALEHLLPLLAAALDGDPSTGATP